MVAFAAMIGCSSDVPSVTPVEGVVIINGKTAPNVLIQFNPSSWPEGTPVIGASALSDTEGRYALVCPDGRKGAPIGKHKVTLIDNNLNVEDEPKITAKRIVNRVPMTYLSPGSTPLEIVVEVGKKDYDLIVGAKK